MTDPITTTTIISTLKEWVENKTLIDSHTWVDAAQKLNVLIGDEHDKLFMLQQAVAQLKVAYLQDGDTSAKAKTKVEAEDIYRDMQNRLVETGR